MWRTTLTSTGTGVLHITEISLLSNRPIQKGKQRIIALESSVPIGVIFFEMNRSR